MRRVLVGTLVATISTLGAASAGPRTSVQTAAQLRNRAGLPKRAPIRLSRIRPGVAGAEKYRIVDLGAPAGFTLQLPAAFNNTGQIVGAAHEASRGNGVVCEFFDGRRYRTLASEPDVTFCDPAALNDMDGKHTVDVVGYIQTAYQFGTSTFNSIVHLDSKVIDNTFFTGNQGSNFAGVNASGVGLASAYYAPLTGFSSQNPPVLRIPGHRSLSLLQPACTTDNAGCGTVVSEQTCPFGGCQITDDGSVLLEDSKGNFELLASNGTVRPLSLGVTLTFLPVINNSQQILYALYDPQLFNNVTRIYNLATGRTTTLPLQPKKNCTSLFAISFSNSGRVLGDVACLSENEPTYFTYDAKHKMQDLSAELPGGTGSVLPMAIDDAGQILVAIFTKAGALHWGILQPKT